MVTYKNQKPLQLITMTKFHIILLHLAVIGVTLWGVHCISEQEKSAVMDLLKPLAGECFKDCNLSSDILKTNGMPPCYKKCLLTKLGLLNENGAYDHDEVKKQIEMFTQGADQTNKLLNMLDDCFDGKEEMQADTDAEDKRIDAIFECLKNSEQS